ncbi:hypothetical protein BT67DRAFT_270440 [Trichocladium antarcticum]|uniref:Uncharacterized protein n=1 Tax=Trichocladium antarcticum TaxID=1450529 RepID=A0AAN6UP37_9PEZI|nr:hypothetical protein BT67DRAFT_270440 [Trichocladium antarcticum]
MPDRLSRQPRRDRRWPSVEFSFASPSIQSGNKRDGCHRATLLWGVISPCSQLFGAGVVLPRISTRYQQMQSPPSSTVRLGDRY